MSTRWQRTYWFSSYGGFASWLIADRFSIVAVKIEDEGLLVTWMILRAKPGSTVVMPARRDGRLMVLPGLGNQAANAMEDTLS